MNDKEKQEWDELEQNIALIKEQNTILLDKFTTYLESQRLAPKTISNHIFNVEVFINDFLVRYDVIPAHNGIKEIQTFFGDFCIRKSVCIRKSQMKENINSIKKFYTFMAQIGAITPEDLSKLNELIGIFSELWIDAADFSYDDDYSF